MPQVIELQPPLAGINKRGGYNKQAPFSAPDCVNVRPVDVLEGRQRIGSRPGLGKNSTDILGDGNKINFLSRLRYVDASDVRQDIMLASSNGTFYKSSGTGTTWTSIGGSVALATDVLIRGSEHLGKLYIADYDDEGPLASATNGTTDGAGTAFDSGSYSDWTAIGANANDYHVVITAGTGVTVGNYAISAIASATITLSSSAGSGASGITFRVERAPKLYDPILNTLTIWTATSGKGQLPSGHSLIARFRDRIYLAGGPDNPWNWHGSRAGDAHDWLTSDSDSNRSVSGSANPGAGQISGDPITSLIPHADECMIIGCKDSLHMMRGDPAFGGRISNLSYEYGVIDKGAWCHAADIAGGGQTIFLSRDGIYVMPRGCGSVAVQMFSRQNLPEELIDVDIKAVTVTMAFDKREHGIYVSLSNNTASDATHYWLSWWEVKGIWPVTLASTDYDPFSVVTYEDIQSGNDSGVVFGCRDGYTRHAKRDLAQDDGNAFVSDVTYGPIKLSRNGRTEGRILEILGVLEDDSGDVDWEIKKGDTAEGSVDSASRETGEWNIGGLQHRAYPRVKGSYACVKLSNGESNANWAVEELELTVEGAGMRRRTDD